MKVRQIKQTEIAEMVNRFSAVVAQLRDFKKRSRLDFGPVGDSAPSLDAPVLPEDVEALEAAFRRIVPSYPVSRAEKMRNTRIRHTIARHEAKHGPIAWEGTPRRRTR